mmetsp:Transcript_22816/g.57920  ORF Transcript_22816/g.57920 Transcript_22816/m.57920 type:complete len:255 (+) Transcript_22816:3448-4212(+)
MTLGHPVSACSQAARAHAALNVGRVARQRSRSRPQSHSRVPSAHRRTALSVACGVGVLEADVAEQQQRRHQLQHECHVRVCESHGAQGGPCFVEGSCVVHTLDGVHRTRRREEGEGGGRARAHGRSELGSQRGVSCEELVEDVEVALAVARRRDAALLEQVCVQCAARDGARARALQAHELAEARGVIVAQCAAVAECLKDGVGREQLGLERGAHASAGVARQPERMRRGPRDHAHDVLGRLRLARARLTRHHH